MFDSDMLSKLVKKTQGIRSLNNFARQCNISASTLSRIINNKNTQPPLPSTLQKIASVTHNDVTMAACGYSNNSENDLKYDSNNILTDENEKDRRITCQHELGHAIMHETYNCTYLKTKTYINLNKIEREADTFPLYLKFLYLKKKC